MNEPPYPPQNETAVFSAWYGQGGPSPVAEVPMALTAEEMKRLYNLVDRLKPHNPVRQIAEAFLTRSGAGLNSLPPILRALTRPNRVRWQERQVAVWVLGSAELVGQQRDYAIDTLIQVLEGRLEPDVSDRLRRVFWRTLIAIIVVAAAGTHMDFSDLFPTVLPVFGVLFWGLFACQRAVDRVAGINVAAEAASALGKLHAVKGLDIVVAATQRVRGARGRKRARLRAAAMAALPSILESVRPEDEGRFRADTIQGLCRLLKSGDEPLAIATLHAFAHIGNAQAVEEVQRLAAGDGRAAYEPRVQSAALQCLPLIQARVARERDPHILLRGSSVPPAPTDQLLRPNPDAAPHDPMQMLRASADPNWKGTEQEISLVVQILQHLQEQGDTRAAPYVEQLVVTAGLHPRIQAAANACLPVLQAHLELERYSPSTPPAQLDLRTNG